MAEYIEREALLAKAVYMHGFGKNKYVPLRAIESAHTADVVEVVRCKDCKYHRIMENKKNFTWWHNCELLCVNIGDNDFCSCGERRKNNG